MADWFAVGVGLASAAEPDEVAALVDETLRAAGIPRDRVRVVATVDTRADHPALAPLGWPVLRYSPSTLATAATPLEPGPPDPFAVDPAPGSASAEPTPLRPPPHRRSVPSAGEPTRRPVAEPAALLAAGPGARLVVPKRRSSRATVAVAAAAAPQTVLAPEVGARTPVSGARTKT